MSIVSKPQTPAIALELIAPYEELRSEAVFDPKWHREALKSWNLMRFDGIEVQKERRFHDFKLERRV